MRSILIIATGAIVFAATMLTLMAAPGFLAFAQHRPSLPLPTGGGPMSYATEITTALATAGRHLSIGRGGCALHFGNARLSGYDCETIKAEARAAGLPLIDSRTVPFELAVVLAVCGPMVAVNQKPSPRPWHGFAYAPLSFVAAAYRKAGAEVVTIPELPEADCWFDEHPPGPMAEILQEWFEHVRRCGPSDG